MPLVIHLYIFTFIFVYIILCMLCVPINVFHIPGHTRNYDKVDDTGDSHAPLCIAQFSQSLLAIYNIMIIAQWDE